MARRRKQERKAEAAARAGDVQLAQQPPQTQAMERTGPVHIGCQTLYLLRRLAPKTRFRPRPFLYLT